MAYRNERSIYWRTCDATWKKILSCYAPENPLTVYEHSYRWSDNWDALSYWVEYQVWTSFFDQFKKLNQAVPKMNLNNGTWNENSMYVHQTDYLKDCYLCFNADQSEKCLYCTSVYGTKYSIDCSNIYYSENCYASVNITNWYKLFYCVEVNDSRDCSFCWRCENCQFCFACVNLVNQKYCIYNKQYTAEEYHILIKKERDAFKNNPSWFNDNLRAVIESQPQRAIYTIQSSNSIGNNLYNCDHVKCCYNMWDARDSSYCALINEHVQDCYDYVARWFHAQRIIENITTWHHADTIGFSFDCRDNIARLRYCASCISCKDCFACVGLRNKQYCIFNKQYDKQSYEKKVAEIIEDMITQGKRWGFFPVAHSLFSYNETIAQLYFPLSQKEAKSRKYPWQKIIYDPTIPSHIEHILGSNLPSIEDVDDSILDKAIICERSGRPFKIQKMELEFYKQYGLPLPSFHYDERYKDLKKKEPEMSLYLRTCDKCGKEMLSVYREHLTPTLSSEERGQKQKIYCEDCYIREVYA